MRKKGRGTGNGAPPPDDGGNKGANPIGNLFDRVTGTTKAKQDAKAKQKELLDKLGGKNPIRDKWLFQDMVENEAFMNASSKFNGPHNQYQKNSQISHQLSFNINHNFESATMTLDNHFDN